MSLPCAVFHLCDACEGGGSSEEEEVGDKCKPEVPSFTEVHNAHEAAE